MINRFHEAILRERPDLEGKLVSFPPEYHNYIAFIGNEVFKRVSGPYSLDGDYAEVKILRRLARAELPVPKVTCIGRINHDDEPTYDRFFGMTRLPGVELRDIASFSWWEARRLAKQLADILFKIAKIFPAKNGYMSHNDLHGGNILVDPKTKELTGLIDFQGLGLYKHGVARPLGGTRGNLIRAFDKAFTRRLKKLPQIKKMEFAR